MVKANVQELNLVCRDCRGPRSKRQRHYDATIAFKAPAHALQVRAPFRNARPLWTAVRHIRKISRVVLFRRFPYSANTLEEMLYSMLASCLQEKLSMRSAWHFALSGKT